MTEGVTFKTDGTKTFIPLENNPQVFDALVQDLGLSKRFGFHDVYSLDDPELLSFVPRPAHSLIFITPAPMYYAVRSEDGIPTDDEAVANTTYDKVGDDEPIMWFKQTIGNACGLIALLHSVANGDPRKAVAPGSTLDKLLGEAAPLKPAPRADVLYNSRELEESHMRAAHTGDSAAPGSAEACGYHFIAFAKGKDGHLWELEGASNGPIDRGQLPEDADMLSGPALDQGVRRFLKHAKGNIEYSIIALCESSG